MKVTLRAKPEFDPDIHCFYCGKEIKNSEDNLYSSGHSFQPFTGLWPKRKVLAGRPYKKESYVGYGRIHTDCNNEWYRIRNETEQISKITGLKLKR